MKVLDPKLGFNFCEFDTRASFSRSCSAAFAKMCFRTTAKVHGTDTLHTHKKGCRTKAPFTSTSADAGSIVRFVEKEVVSAADKSRMTVAMAKCFET